MYLSWRSPERGSRADDRARGDGASFSAKQGSRAICNCARLSGSHEARGEYPDSYHNVCGLPLNLKCGCCSHSDCYSHARRHTPCRQRRRDAESVFRALFRRGNAQDCATTSSCWKAQSFERPLVRNFFVGGRSAVPCGVECADGSAGRTNPAELFVFIHAAEAQDTAMYSDRSRPRSCSSIDQLGCGVTESTRLTDLLAGLDFTPINSFLPRTTPGITLAAFRHRRSPTSVNTSAVASTLTATPALKFS